MLIRCTKIEYVIGKISKNIVQLKRRANQGKMSS
jgi:hypothetical protein